MWSHVEMKEKQNITLYLNKHVTEKARELGLNISKYCENSLIQAIEALTSVSYVREGGTGTVGSDLVARGRFELPSTGPKPAIQTNLYSLFSSYSSANAVKTFIVCLSHLARF
jgi:hypothetical protein